MTLRLGSRRVADDDFLIMAIVNRTPDSFYDRGSTFGDQEAMAAVDRAVAEGADIIDIGGVKAGPGEVVETAEEINRTVGFVAKVRERHPDVVISIDTWRHEVADAACGAGADLVNDAWGGHDPQVALIAAHHDVGLVCTHAGGAHPRTRPHRVTYDDVVQDVVAFAVSETTRALDVGVRRDGLIVDPGHDFGKNTRHSLTITRHLDALVALGWPVLVSLSNKDFIGESLDLPVSERLVGTLAATAVTAWLGARIFRVHQPEETRQVVQMVSVIRGQQAPAVSRRGLA
jgi:dihydropteroate synthase